VFDSILPTARPVSLDATVRLLALGSWRLALGAGREN